MKNLTSAEFNAEVLNGSGKTVVDFWAPWCGPCRAQGPILEELAIEMPDVNFVKVNVDEQTDLAIKYGVASIPTLLFFENGKLVNQAIGLHSKQDVKAML